MAITIPPVVTPTVPTTTTTSPITPVAPIKTGLPPPSQASAPEQEEQEASPKLSVPELMYLVSVYFYCEAAKIANEALSDLNRDLLIIEPSSSPNIRTQIEAAETESAEVAKEEAAMANSGFALDDTGIEDTDSD